MAAGVSAAPHGDGHSGGHHSGGHHSGGHHFGGHHGGGHFGWGAPYYGYPYGYPYYPYYYYYSPASVASAPPVYVQRAPSPALASTWYYCLNPPGYYPNVRDCPGGWQTVPAQ